MIGGIPAYKTIKDAKAAIKELKKKELGDNWKVLLTKYSVGSIKQQNPVFGAVLYNCDHVTPENKFCIQVELQPLVKQQKKKKRRKKQQQQGNNSQGKKTRRRKGRVL